MYLFFTLSLFVSSSVQFSQPSCVSGVPHVPCVPACYPSASLVCTFFSFSPSLLLLFMPLVASFCAWNFGFCIYCISRLYFIKAHFLFPGSWVSWPWVVLFLLYVTHRPSMASFEIRSRLNYNTENFFSENFTENHSFKKKSKEFQFCSCPKYNSSDHKGSWSVVVQQHCCWCEAPWMFCGLLTWRCVDNDWIVI